MNSRRFIALGFSILGLFAVRFFETDLFYDPLIEFFKRGYQSETLPKINGLSWGFNLIGRYLLNAFLSVMILNAIFQKKTIIQFSVILYGTIIVVLLPVLLGLIHYYEPGEYRGLFYVRRFLIHPVLLLLLIPSFYMLRPNKNN